MAVLADIIGRGLASARPAAGTEGRLYFSTDTAVLERDNGSGWDSVEGGGNTGNIAFSGDISPSQITADQNDYNPTGLSTASTLRLSSDASRSITGLQGGADGRLLLVHNVGSNNIVLEDEDAGSSAANRFALSADLTLGADQSAILQYDSTSSRWRCLASSVGSGGGGGGAPSDATYVTESANGTLSAESVLGSTVITQTAHASRQAAASSGRLHFPTNGVSITRDDGSAWDPYGPLYPLTVPPSSGTFTWLNQGSSTIADEKDLLHLFIPKETGLQVRGMHKSAPATPYTISALILPTIFGVSQLAFGLIWRQSSDGKFVIVSMESDTSNCHLSVHKFNGVTSVNSTYVSFELPYAEAWVRIEDDGTNRKVHLSRDGQYWTQIHTIGRTDFLTADQVGFAGWITGNTYDLHASILSWAQA